MAFGELIFFDCSSRLFSEIDNFRSGCTCGRKVIRVLLGFCTTQEFDNLQGGENTFFYFC
jgi:hypothetical protein